MKTTERQRRELRHRATRPSNERYRTYPLQLRLPPEEVLALLDDLEQCVQANPNSRVLMDSEGLLLRARDLLAQLRGGAKDGVHRDITRYLEARPSPTSNDA